MRRVFTAAGVDFDQWKALSIVTLKLDLRGSTIAQRQFGHERTFVAALIFQAIFYTLFGALIAYFMWTNRDMLLVGTVAATYTAFLIGTAVILDHNSVIASPSDYAILGFRPVSSRTYFAVKLTNILIYTTALTTIAAWVPILAAFVRLGWRMGVAVALDMYGASTATTLAIALGYASVLRLVGPDAIERALSYVQVVMGFAVYGTQLVLTSSRLSRAAISSWTMPDTWWLLLYPGTWFGSYLELASDGPSPRAALLSLASLTLLIVLSSRLGGRLSLAYSERLGAMISASRAAKSRGRSRPALWFTSGESRAVALLVRSQFRYDSRFRMGVLGVLPLTFFYLWIGIRDGTLVDPFTPGAGMRGWPVSMAVLVMPAMLRTLLTRSDSFRASWLFFTCPSDHMRIARALKDVIVAFFLIPYLALVFAIYTYIVGNAGHVLVHLAFLGLIGHLVAQVAVLIDPSLPFSKPMVRNMGSVLFFAFTIAIVLVSSVVQFLAPRLYHSPSSMVAAVAGIVMTGALLDWLTRLRVERQARTLEFEG